jgi:CheY-like chemotaxis protein
MAVSAYGAKRIYRSPKIRVLLKELHLFSYPLSNLVPYNFEQASWLHIAGVNYRARSVLVLPRKNSKDPLVSQTILLIDDSKFLRRANELALGKAGYNVLAASDGEDGLQIAREKLPDLIVLDMLLPILSGPQLLDALKKDPRTATIPVIVLSSLPQRNEGKLKSNGAVAYFEKSAIEVDKGSTTLIRAIENALRLQATAAHAAGR